MVSLKKLLLTAIAGVVAVSGFSGISLSGINTFTYPYAYAADEDEISAQADEYSDLSEITGDSFKQSSASETTTVAASPTVLLTTAVETKAPETVTTTVTTVTEAPKQTTTVTTVPSFEVFDIYEAHMKFIASSTTTTTTTTAKTTTTTVTTTKVVTTTAGPKDYSSGLKGMDVSRWQGTIDWSKVKSSGINFALIRAGYGDLSTQIDEQFKANIAGATNAGIDYGIYWYSYATTVEDAYLEAEACYEVIKGYKFKYPLYFDIEDSTQVDLSTATISGIVDAFCSTMESKGYYVGVYSCASFLNTKVYANVLSKYDVWVAHFGVSSPSVTSAYGIWQYTSSGSVNGISGNVDLNYAYKDYPYIITTKHKNGY
jgi:GH25 family lysozyme M1 (1,4-beta-N-acetylmuramidase)